MELSEIRKCDIFVQPGTAFANCVKSALVCCPGISIRIYDDDSTCPDTMAILQEIRNLARCVRVTILRKGYAKVVQSRARSAK